MIDTTNNVKRVLKLQAQALRAQADVLEASAESLPDADADSDALLGTRESLQRYGIGHEAVRAAAERGALAVQRGARGKLLVLESELRRYIASRPYKPTPRRALPPVDLDQWEQEADRVLHIVGRRGK